jgi:outer membrane receptor protein involved in Fe transport
MRKRTNLLVGGILLLLFGSLSYAQQTAVIHGTIVDEAGAPLPGGVLTIESPNLIGTRSATSRETGEFLFRLLPPGSYTLTVTMPGMATVKQTVELGLGQTSRPRIRLTPETQSEEMIVTASADPVLDTTDVAANFTSEFVDKLANGRGIEARTILAPGTTATGPNGAVSISGAESYENLYLLNGGVFNFDNIRGRPGSAFIPDAIQETTVLSASVSAEYGNFTGGIINTITKSGGNEFSGSFRAALTNDDWRGRTPLEIDSGVERADSINETFSLTLGGPIIKDRLWFFVAGLYRRDDSEGQLTRPIPLSDTLATALGIPTGQTSPGARSVPSDTKDDRYELKLTGKIAEGHDLVFSWTEREIDVTNDTSRGNLDLASVPTARSIPENLLSLNYRGVFSPEFSVDVIYTKKQAQFSKPTIDPGDDIRYTGTTLQDRNTGSRFFSPTFANGPPEDRDNRTAAIKANYFLITDNSGSHDLSFGYQDYKDYRKADNVQSASGYEFWNVYTRWEGDQIIPIFSGGQNGTRPTGIIYWPIQNSSIGTDFTTTSAYINDRWTLNEKWTFNVGVRYDKNDSFAEDGRPASQSDNTSPRIAIEYDLRGDGKHKFTTSYAQYVARLTDTAQNASTAGSPTYIYWFYTGPITENIRDVYQWFEDLYGPDSTVDPLAPAGADFLASNLANNLVPTDGGELLTQVDPNLESPNSVELRLGYSTRWTKGFYKVDFIDREFHDIYATYVTQETGTLSDGTNDIRFLTNDDDNYMRKYHAVQMQGAWYVADNFTLSGNYTWSQLYGNLVAETEGSGSISASALTFYPEWNNFSQAYPSGRLPTDQRHRMRLFASYDLNTAFGDINFSATQRYESASNYSAAFTIQDGAPSFEDYGLPSSANFTLGYVFPPTSTSYFVGGRGSYETEAMTQTDLGINYALQLGRLEFFVEMNVFNLFNQDAAPYSNNGWYNTNVTTLPTAFNVYNEEPVEGVHFEFDPDFGTPASNNAYQTPRTLTVDFGLKF